MPLDEILVDAKHGDHTHFHLVTATVTLADGRTGTGYTYNGGRGGHATAAMITHDLAPFLIGQDATNVEALTEAMDWHMHYVGRGGILSFALSALDIALWDARLKGAGQSLLQAAGGASPCCKAYGGGIDLGFDLPRLLRSIQTYLDRGHNAVKIKIGQPTQAEDVARIAAVRDLIGPDVTFMVDANYSMTVDQAIAMAKAIKRPMTSRGSKNRSSPTPLKTTPPSATPPACLYGAGRKPAHDARICPRAAAFGFHPAGCVELSGDYGVVAGRPNGQGCGCARVQPRHAGIARVAGVIPTPWRLARSAQFPH